MGDNDNLTREMGEVRATLASDLGRLKADFAALLGRVEQLRESHIQFQQTLAQLAELQQRLTNAVDLVNKLSSIVNVQETNIVNNKTSIMSELSHLRESVLQKMETEIINLDRSIVERLPHETILHNIEDLYSKFNDVDNKISSKVAGVKADLEKQNATTQSDVKKLEEKHTALDGVVQTTKSDIKVQNVKIGIGVNVAGIILNLALTLGFKYIFDSTPKQNPPVRAESTQTVKHIDSNMPSDSLK